ncbi:glycerol dehydrogenase [Tepidibacter aestuarii]|uniref:glycerol dehydrogenase n=1 Tax=Tepidibacter aestuarii TaxID=2925782 RepID=UPI0020C0B3B1|nr:glycerol dehydrogenase [Tepidibacter aestuarii]CAH2214985.1 L-1,2-propanediol dehydrogenase/glycerol dehydrogenase [Tepidibacter aestuarii]
MLAKIINSPSKYVQGYGELSRIENYTKYFAKKPFIIADSFVTGLTKDIVDASYLSNDREYVMEVFNGECSKVEINRLKAIVEEKGCDMIVGIGGGKTLDTAKAIAFYTEYPVMVVPTIASTDAPCTALTVIYTEEGVFDEYLFLPTNPAIVLMDTKIIAGAPARLLVSGMGDALATYFEVRACKHSNELSLLGAYVTEAAFALAELCYKTLLSDGVKAKLAVENNVSNTSVEKIIEANTYLSGVGAESGGLAAAHSIHNGLTALEECHHFSHGEKVAFGTLVQLVLENAPMEEIKEVIDFCNNVGLPVTLEAINAHTATEEQLRKVAKLSVAEGETIHNMPFKVTANDVYAAILVADKLGKELS